MAKKSSETKNHSKNTEPTKSEKTAAQVAEILVSEDFRRASDETYADSPESYSQRRENLNPHLGEFAMTLVNAGKRPIQSDRVWDTQRRVVAASLEGEGIGPFADYFFAIQPGNRPAESQPADGNIYDLPDGEYDVVQTNSRIVSLSNSEPHPTEFLEGALDIIKQRRRTGGKAFEGPENYATAMKFFADKSRETPLGTTIKERKTNIGLVSDTLAGFERTAERDQPNIVEITNILSAIKTLPKGIVEKKFSPMVLRHSVNILNDFSARGVNVLIGAMGKLNVEECPEEAAMTLDLALRKGVEQERTGDMLAVLRALTNLPRTRASERAVSTFLRVRNSMEIASGLDELEEINARLLMIVDSVTESPVDTQAIKGIANHVAQQAFARSRSGENAKLPIEDLDRLNKQVGRIIGHYKKI
jgi:hypothetical protein